ncbi:g6423 [Coccomyxa elongata]
MATYIGNKFGKDDHDKLADYERRANPNDKGQQALLEEMRAHLKKKNFGKPVEWALVKDHAWSTPQLRKLDQPVDVDGKPWPLDTNGKPVPKA